MRWYIHVDATKMAKQKMVVVIRGASARRTVIGVQNIASARTAKTSDLYSHL